MSKATYTCQTKYGVTDITVSDTYKIQRASIALFASQLGYVYDMFNEQDGGSFYNAEGQGKHKHNMLSFETMQKLHNTCFVPWSSHGLDAELPEAAKRLDLDVASLYNAIEAKLVKRTYFQVVRKKSLKVQKHIIEL